MAGMVASDGAINVAALKTATQKALATKH